MATASQTPVAVEYMKAAVYGTAKSEIEDPFRHLAGANSHNHHTLHPWGENIIAGTEEFDSLYAEANNQYMYHLWYTGKLAPYMATEVLKIEQLSPDLIQQLQFVIHKVLETGIDVTMQSDDAQALVASFQTILDEATKGSSEPIFVRLGATSAKDSFAKGAPTTKPGPLPADAELVLRRFLTSGRVVGRLLALADELWVSDPGEALIIQRWSPEIELQREIRVFCYAGEVTAISQDIWWEKAGWRDRYSGGFAEAILNVWRNVKVHLPFDTCTMDVLVTPPSNGESWTAKIIEFNGFGAHLNTGSDLFHWVKDEEILQGKAPGVTIRFVDDWEAREMTGNSMSDSAASVSESLEEEEPDWLVLERQLKAKYADKGKDAKAKLPLRGRWYSAY
ncbi:hypothetical protein F5Y10DRAFT_285092 [Nemania abortiva]|nr:hypothetical protein F5Y10DRAFT_285092 [Nemania abortiva]